MIKRFFALLLAALLYFGTAMPVFAVDETPNLSGGVVKGFTFERVFSMLSQQKYRSDRLDGLYDNLTLIADRLDCTMELDGELYDAVCTATWSVSGVPLDEMDFTVLGEYEIIATIIPPTSCTFGEGVRTQIVLPVLIYEQGKQEIISIFNYKLFTKGMMFAVGDSEACEREISSREGFISASVGGFTQENDVAELVLESFDSEEVDINTPGEYFVTAVYRIDDVYTEDFTISDEVRTLEIPVRVSDPVDFDLWLGDMDNSNFHLYYIREFDEYPSVQWASSESFLDDAQLKTADWSECPTDVGMIDSDAVRINRNELIKDRYYYFRLQRGEMISTIVHIMDDGVKVNYGSTGGDRDGGDGGGFKPPDVEQPGPDNGIGSGAGSNGDSDSDADSGSDSGSGEQNPPETTNPTPKPDPSVPPTTAPTLPEPEPIIPPTTTPTPETSTPPTTTPTPEPSATTADQPTGTPVAAVKQPQAPKENKPVITESFGETMNKISGARLRIMLETGGVKFSGQGVTVKLSDTALAAMNIQDSDSFTVLIERTSDNAFLFFIEQNDIPLGFLPDTQILLPYQLKDDGAVLTLQNVQGELVCKGNFHKAVGIATFTVDAIGSFTIVETADTLLVAALSGNPPTEGTPLSAAPAKPKSMSGTAVAVASAIVLVAAAGGVWLYRKRRWIA